MLLKQSSKVKIALLIALIILLGLIVFLVVLAIKIASKKQTLTAKTQKQEAKSTTPDKAPDIKELLKFASDSSKSRNDLANLVYVFSQLKWPEFTNPISKDAELYLSFILLIASHKNADAKLVTYLNSESKKLNPAYYSLIEEYENIGLSSRKK